MGRPPRELTPLESALHFFGAELRHWRTLRGLSQMGTGLRTHDSGSLISKIEKGERYPGLELTRRLDEVLDTGGVLEQLWPPVEKQRVNRAVATNTLRDSPEPIQADLGLEWPATPAATVEVVGRLWRADMERRSVLLSAAWMSSAFTHPVQEWLLHRQEEIRQEHSGRTVGQHDIDALWAMCEAFTATDLRLGGGYGRSTLVHYVNEIVLPLLHGSYSDAIGRELLTATARLCDICGFMSFDSGRQGLAQRYFIQALRLAQASGNRALGAHILADMSCQAHYLGNSTQALELATAGHRTALDCGALSTAAKCVGGKGLAHALRGDQRAADKACLISENMLNRTAAPSDRTWFIPFTIDQLTAQRLYIAHELGRTGDVQRIAPAALAFSGGSARRHVMYTTTLASSYLSVDGNRHSDPDRACELLGQALPSLGSLHSTRGLERFNAVRRALAAHATRPSVQEFEDRFRATITTAL